MNGHGLSSEHSVDYHRRKLLQIQLGEGSKCEMHTTTHWHLFLAYVGQVADECRALAAIVFLQHPTSSLQYLHREKNGRRTSYSSKTRVYCAYSQIACD